MYDHESLQLPGNPVVNLILPSFLPVEESQNSRVWMRVQSTVGYRRIDVG